MYPRVTVVVVCYNQARFVAECLESVRRQTRPAYRVLITDDLSTDSSRDEIRRYLEDHPGFGEFLPNRRNIGLNRTLDRMLALIETDLYTVIAADDVMRNDRLEVQVDLLDGTGHVLAYSDARVIDADSRLLEQTSAIEYAWPPEPDRSKATFTALLEGNWIPAASLLLRTDVMRSTGGYPPLLFEDYELLVRLSKAGSFSYSTEPLVSVRRVDGSMMSTRLHRGNPDYIRTLDYVYRHYEGSSHEVVATARSRRWELAKAALRTAMPRREVLGLLWAARRGARSRLSFTAHVVRASVTPRRSGQ